MDFLRLLEKQVKENPQKTALNFRETPVTFSQLKDQALKVASGLSALGINRQDKVAIYLGNSPEYVYSFLGVFILRATAVPLDYMLTEEELVNFINHSEAKILIAQEKKGVDFSSLKNRCPGLEKVIFEIPSAAGGSLPRPEIKDDDFSTIFYTSGSTGHPKGVLLSYAQLKNPLDTFEYFLHPNDKDSLINPGIPFSHLGGLDYLLFMLYYGITLTLQERFQPLEFLKGIQNYKPTIFCIVPPMYVAILSLKEFNNFDLSSLRYAVVFGAPSSPVLLQRFLAQAPNAYLLNGWGMTETSAPNAFLPTGTNTKEVPHTGEFQPGIEAKIVDGEGNALPDGKEGELWLRGKAIMKGYYKEPGLTAQTITKDAWLKTGDVARRDAQGRCYIVGRIKEMIKVAGEIVFEPEVEAVLLRHPDIAEAAVIGVTDKLRGEVPKAFIVTKEAKTVAEDDLKEFLRQHLAHFKIPHHFEFVAQLPKNRTGKIDKEKLRVHA